MPMHDVGYRKWTGKLTSMFARWWMIAESGIDITFRSQWIKRMLLAAWIPIIAVGTMVFIFERNLIQRDIFIKELRREAELFGIDIDDEEQVMEELRKFEQQSGIMNLPPEVRDFIDDPEGRMRVDPGGNRERRDDRNRDRARDNGPTVRKFDSRTPIADQIRNQIGNARGVGMTKEQFLYRLQLFKKPRVWQIAPHQEIYLKAFTSTDAGLARKIGWSYFLTLFLAYPQGIATVILMALIVPPLISRDLRSRAYFIYFAKPIGRLEYLLGKFTIPAVFLISITTLPAIGLFVFAVMLSPDFSVLSDTWHLLFRIFLASGVMIIPTVSLALMLSSLTEESRFATFSWFAIWVLTAGAYLVMYVFNMISQVLRAEQSGQNLDQLLPLHSNWQLISLYHSIMNVQSWIFGVTPLDFSVIGGLILLAVITLFSWVILYWRVSAPISI